MTKWIHLNWGDEGIRKLFHRAYAHLHPGGHFILEAQAYESYAKKKKITVSIINFLILIILDTKFSLTLTIQNDLINNIKIYVRLNSFNLAMIKMSNVHIKNG